MKAAAPVAPRHDSIPVSVDSNDDEVDQTQFSKVAPPPPPVPKISSPRPSGSKIPTPSGRMPAAMSARVLLVDDDPDIRDVVGAMLEAVGLIVEPATTAEVALERAREKHFDLLVLDWSLPGMTGLELCRKIRAEPTLSTIPVLFLTAHSSSKDIVDAFASGADDYVAKPFRAPELGARIFGLLRRARTPHGNG
jgi:two-component system, OmpR family, phosphate regulon response regulator PhoB